MVSTIYLKTDQLPSKLFPKGHTWVKTSINQTIECIARPTLFMFETRQDIAPLNTNIYLHDAAPTEPGGDGSINETDFTGLSVTTYSAVAGNYIHSFTSENGFFTANQDFADHNVKWEITYNTYYTGTPTEGTVPLIRFEFYKRNAGNSDTLLFSIKHSPRTIQSETTQTFAPIGSVLTSDRLRIRVFGGEEVPT